MTDDLPPDLERLRTLETWLQISLDRVRERIREVEKQQAADRQRAETVHAVPDWVMEHGIGQGRPPVAVHVGGCHMAGKRLRTLTREQAVRALSDGVEACTHCRPDTELGILD